LNITEKTGNLIAIKSVSDENDLMIINRSGVIIRIAVANLRIMGRATQGVRLINLRKNDSIAAVAKVDVTEEDEELVEGENPVEGTEGSSENNTSDESGKDVAKDEDDN
jgi:DNA gyrase subunit A